MMGSQCHRGDLIVTTCKSTLETKFTHNDTFRIIPTLQKVIILRCSVESEISLYREVHYSIFEFKDIYKYYYLYIECQL